MFEKLRDIVITHKSVETKLEQLSYERMVLSKKLDKYGYVKDCNEMNEDSDDDDINVH